MENRFYKFDFYIFEISRIQPQNQRFGVSVHRTPTASTAASLTQTRKQRQTQTLRSKTANFKNIEIKIVKTVFHVF